MSELVVKVIVLFNVAIWFTRQVVQERSFYFNELRVKILRRIIQNFMYFF